MTLSGILNLSDLFEYTPHRFKRTGKRNDIFVATKFGFTVDPNRPLNASPEYVKQACESSLKRLGVSCIDLYYVHRADPTVPIEVRYTIHNIYINFQSPHLYSSPENRWRHG